VTFSDPSGCIIDYPVEDYNRDNPKQDNKASGNNIENAKTQAISNFKEIKNKQNKIDHYETEVNGIKFILNANSNNTKEMIKKSDATLWNNLSIAAGMSDINAIQVFSIKHNLNKAHKEGRGMDISGFYTGYGTKNQKFIAGFRTYDKLKDKWSATSKSNIALIEKLSTAFLEQSGSTKVLGYNKITDKTSGEPPYNNLINQHPDVGKIKTKSIRTSDFDQFIKLKNINQKQADMLFRSYQHSNHFHFEVR